MSRIERLKAHVGWSVIAFHTLDANADGRVYLQTWDVAVPDDGDLPGEIARQLAWHREDGMLKGDDRMVVCAGWEAAPQPAPPKGQMGLF